MATKKQTAPGPAGSASANFYLIHGEDEYRVKTATHLRVDALCPPADQAFGLEIINGTVDNAEGAALALRHCLGALRTPSFLGGRKVVWLQDANFFADTNTIKGETVKEARDAFAQALKPGIGAGFTLVISAGKVDGRTAFAKVCKEIASVETFATPEKSYQQEKPALDWAGECCQRAGLRISGALLQAFVDRSGYDTRQIITEVEKLSIYLGTRKDVTAEDIRLLVSPARESEHWDLPDAVGLRNLPQALEILRQLFFQGENPVGMVIGLEGRWRELLILRGCLDRGWLQISSSGWRTDARWNSGAEVDAALGSLDKDPRTTHPFRTAKLAEQAQKYSAAELQRALAETIAAHEQMVSGSGAADVLLELLLLKLLRPAAGPARKK
jgi:DNA polymerase-3 subunit delta